MSVDGGIEEKDEEGKERGAHTHTQTHTHTHTQASLGEVAEFIHLYV